MTQTYVAIDLETTGLDPARDDIIEIGCVSFCGSEVVDEWSSLVNPGRPIPARVSQLTGITHRDVSGAPRLAEVLPTLRDFVGSLPMVAHNARFDLGFLREAGVTFPGPALDTFELASILLSGQPSYSLAALADHFQLSSGRAHRALDDARTTAGLFAALEEVAASLPLATLIEINRLSAQSSWSLGPVFARAERQATRTRFLKRHERAALEAGSLGPLLNQAMARLPWVEEALEPTDQLQPIDEDMLAAFLEPGGPLATIFPEYEHREPQVEMLRAVASAFNNGDHLLIEAGTGTGKSLAYLLPAIAWAVQNRRRVVISTNTINLQDQLMDKDLPDLEQVFAALLNGTPSLDSEPGFRQLAEQAQSLRVAVMKGRSNYLCPRRLDALRSRSDLGEDALRVLARVLAWLPRTSTGDRAEIFLAGGRDEAIWSRVATESGTCTAERCEQSQGGRCFFYRNRRHAEAAHLVIVNHALLLSDVAVGSRALPEYHHLIVDEAHHLENATTQQLSFRASEDGLNRLLADLWPNHGEESRGLLHDLRRRAQGLSPTIRHSLERETAQAQRLTERCRERFGHFFLLLGEFLGTRQGHSGPYSLRVRLDGGVRSQPLWSEVEIAWDSAGTSLYELFESVDRLRGGLTELDEAGVVGIDDLLADSSSISGQLLKAYEQLDAAIVRPEPDGIYWVEAAPISNRLSIHVAPLHIGPLVEAHLFHQKENVILTSATLRTAGTYDYIQERLHAGEARMVTVGSPFDYRASTLVYVPTDLAAPDSPAYQGQVEAAVRSLAKALEGRTLALFTSYNQLRRTAEGVSQELAAAGITVYQQGEGGSRQQLLDNFRSTDRSVLLGTRSFWEGIDVVGPALSGLVLTRLPFAVPSDPIVAARAETFDEPFYQYSVPDAILRFRQGFGRLIRSRQDRGICLILDNRVLTKRYGQLFLDSLPDCTIQRAPLGLMAKAAVDWLQPRQASQSSKNRFDEGIWPTYNPSEA